MFWVDKRVAEIEKELQATIASGKELVVRDEKTVSGHPHIGSLVGVAVHDFIARVLQEKGISARFHYELNDTDPMDGMPSYLDASVYEEHMGKPLKDIPAPDNSYPNLAEYFAADFMNVITESGFHPEFYRTSELYNSGRMNEVIRIALERADDIRRIYKEVSGSEKPDDWLPLNVVCEHCGKVGTTKVISFDGERVTYVCREHGVKWATGCNHKGEISPFDGNATMPWKVEWAAKFKVMQVDVEGAGKDHSTKGGARDVARHIVKEVFDYKDPFDIPYEFFLVGGKKMSSSKGNASTAREITDILPEHILRLALVGRDINRQTNFDPEGDSIPFLFDQYDRFAASYWENAEEKNEDHARIFELVHSEDQKKLLSERFLPRFSQVAFIVQMPHLDIEKEVAVMKESELTDADKAELKLRAEYAKKWLEKYAPEEYKFVIQETLPEPAQHFSDAQKSALKKILEYVEGTSELDGKSLHEKLHEIKTEEGIAPKELFSAIYRLFLDRDSGPQAGWFLSTLDRDFLIKQLSEAQ